MIQEEDGANGAQDKDSEEETEEKLAESPLLYSDESLDAVLSFGSDVKLPEGTALEIREFDGLPSFQENAEKEMTALGLTELSESRYFRIVLTKDGKDVDVENGSIDIQINFHKNADSENAISHADDQVYAGLFDAVSASAYLFQNNSDQDKTPAIRLDDNHVITSLTIRKIDLQTREHVVAIIGGRAPEEETEAESELDEVQTEVGTEDETEAETEAPAPEAKKRVYPINNGRIRGRAILSDPAQIPDDAELVITEVTPSSGEYNYDAYMEALNNISEKEYDQSNALLFDIAFIGPEKDEEGNETGKMVEYQPKEGSVKIVLTLEDSPLSDGLGAEKAEDVQVIHLPLEESAKETAATTAEATNISSGSVLAESVEDQSVGLNGSSDHVSFNVSSFSVFAFTVDFHYNGKDYSIPGMSQILLSELIEKLQITYNDSDELLKVADVASVEFTDEHLVEVTEVSGLITIFVADDEKRDVDAGEKDFLLSSKEPFTSNEQLTITLLDGIEIQVGVTDAQEPVEYELCGQSSITLETLYKYFDWNYSYVKFCIKEGYTSEPLIYFKKENPHLDISNISFQYDNEYTITISGLNTIPAGECVIVDATGVDPYTQPRIKIIQPDYAKDFIYNIGTDGVTITGLVDNYIGNGHIVIPDRIDDSPVVAISDAAFDGSEQFGNPEKNGVIKSVTFNNTSLLTIGNYAFCECVNLESINCNGPINYIGEDAFYNCTNMKEVLINGDVENFGRYPFDCCTGLETVIINGKVGSLGYNAFYNCSSLKTVTITQPLNHIPEWTFQDCSSLETLNVVPSDTSGITVGVNAFIGCDRLNTIVNYPQKLCLMWDEDHCINYSVVGEAPLGANLQISEKYDVSKEVDSTILQKVDFIGEKEIKYLEIKLTAPSGAACTNGNVQISGGSFPVIVFDSLPESGSSYRVYPIYGEMVDNETNKITCDISGKLLTGQTLENVTQGVYAIAYQIDPARYHDNTFYYDVDSDKHTAVVSGIFNKTAPEVTVTAETQNDDKYPVTGIKAGVFRGNNVLTKVTCNTPGMFDPQDEVFSNMSKLKELDIAVNNYTDNSGLAFISNCPNLDTLALLVAEQDIEVLIGTPFQSLGTLKNLTIGVDENHTIGRIGQQAFKDFSGLEALTILNALSGGERSNRSIGENAFEGCSNLRSLSIGTDGNNDAKTIYIAKDAFKGCNSLTTKVTVEQDVECDAGIIVLPATEEGLPLGAYVVKTDEVNEADKEILREQIAQTYSPNGFEAIYFDLSLITPAGDVVNEVLPDDKWFDLDYLNITLPLSEKLDKSYRNTRVFHKVGDSVEVSGTLGSYEGVRIELWNEDLDDWNNPKNVTQIGISTHSFSPFAVAVQSVYHDNEFYYNITGSDEEAWAEIIGLYNPYNQPGLDVTVKSTTQNNDAYPVRHIKEKAFKGETALGKVTFEVGNDFTVYDSAFEDSSITELEFKNDGAIHLEGKAFSRCSSLNSVIFNGTAGTNENVVFREGGVFAGCTSLNSVSSVLGRGGVTFVDDALNTFAGSAVATLDLCVYNMPKGLNHFADGGMDNLRSLKLNLQSPLTLVTASGSFPLLESVEIDPQKHDLTLSEDVFGEARNLRTVSIKGTETDDYNGKVSILGNAFSKTGLHTFETNCRASISENAFANVLNDGKVLLTAPDDYHQNVNEIFPGAFPNQLATLRIDRCDAVNPGSFNGVTNLVFNDTRLPQELSGVFGKVTNLIIMKPLDDSQTAIKENTFDGGTNNPAIVYFANLIPERAQQTVNKAIEGAGNTTTFYFNWNKEDYKTANNLKDLLLKKQGDVPVVYYLNNGTSNGLYFGQKKNDEPDGTRENPYYTFEQVKKAAKEIAADSGDQSVDIQTPLIDFNSIIESVGLTPHVGKFKYTISGRNIYIVNTVTVSDTQTWESDDTGDKLVLYRDPKWKGALVEITGTLTLKNIIIDGNSENIRDVNSAMIVVKSSDSLHLLTGSELRNNDHSASNYPRSGGAVLVDGGKVVVDGGSIHDNRANWGGGIHALGGTVELKSGEIRDNEATSGGSKPCGGGVALNNRANMTMSGGTVSNNKSASVGGGISVGIPYAATEQRFHEGYLEMTAGAITNNISASEGGGMYIEGDSTAHVKSGTISENASKSGAFGGGGIYVNGGRYLTVVSTADGHLYLDNVVVTGNSASQNGGGLAGCSTSTSEINLINGAAFYNNGEDDIYVEKTANLGSNMTAYISTKRFDKQDHEWKDMNGIAVPAGRIAKTKETTQIKAGNTSPANGGSVFITNNTSNTNGGGIGSNGSVTVGTKPSGSSEVYFTPDVWKQVKGRDMRAGENFTFKVYEGKYEIGGVNTYLIYTSVEEAKDKAGNPVTGTVTFGKDGEKTKIKFSNSIYLGDYNEAGEERLFLVVEDDADGGTTILDNHYLVFRVVIGTDFDENGNAVFSAGVSKIGIDTLERDADGKLKRDENGNPAFNKRETAPYYPQSQIIRPDEAVFTNIFNEREITVSKEWLGYDLEKTVAPAGAKVTFTLFADGVATDNRVVLDGVADGNLTANSTLGEWAPWTASFKKLPIYRTDKAGDNNEKIVYTVKETLVEPAECVELYAAVEDTVGISETNPYAANPIKNKHKTGNLEVSKKIVSDVQVDDSKEFDMTVTLGDTTIGGDEGKVFGDMTFKNGVSTFKLKNGERKTAAGLPVGVTYSVHEATVPGYTADKETKSGEIHEGTSSVLFTNTYSTSGTGEVKVQKNLSGREWTEDDSFEFIVTPVGDAPAFPEDKVTVTMDSADYAESFGTVTFTKPGTYRWTVSEAHKGETIDYMNYDSEDQTVTIVVRDDGRGHLVAEDGSALVQTAAFTNTFDRRVEVSKVDAETKEKLGGAHLQVLDPDGSVVDEWDSDDQVHELKGIEVGVTYTLHETSAPSGYAVAEDTTFIMNDKGEITGTMTIDAEGVLLIEDAKVLGGGGGGPIPPAPQTEQQSESESESETETETEPSSETESEKERQTEQQTEVLKPGTGSISVTKYTLKDDGAYRVANETYYTALFKDKGLTTRVTDVKSLVLKEEYSKKVTFHDLPNGTYYVAETDDAGIPISSGEGIQEIEIEDGKVKLNTSGNEGGAVIKNTVSQNVLGEHVDVSLAIRKKVLDSNGNELKVKDTFYIALYSNKKCTKRIPGIDILRISLDNASEGAAQLRNLPYASEFYIAEVDEDGNKVAGQDSFNYEVKVKGNGLTYRELNQSEVVVINQLKSGRVAGENRDVNGENRGESQNGELAGVRTGDETPVVPMLVTMVTAGLAAIFLALRRRKARSERDA